MPDKITKRLLPAYYAPSKGRHYLSLRSALRAEAIAKIRLRYPTERDEPDVGLTGWHWREMPNADKLLRRMIAYLRAHMQVTMEHTK